MTPGPNSLRLGFLVISFLLHGPRSGKPQLHCPRAQSGVTPDPENVQCRAVFIQYQRAVVPQAATTLPRSNPFPTHGTVESPAKLFLSRLLKNRELPLPIKPWGSKSNPFHWLAATLTNLISSSTPVPETSAWGRSRFSWPSCARRPWPACMPMLWSPPPCWSWLSCGHTSAGSSRRSAWQS